MSIGNKIDETMQRGIDGTLLGSIEGLSTLRRKDDTARNAFVFVSYGVATFVTLVLSFILGFSTSFGGVFASQLITHAVWITLALVYIALATEVSHKFAAYGIFLVGAILTAFSAFGPVMLINANQMFSEISGENISLFYSTPVLVLWLLLDLALAAGYGFACYRTAVFISKAKKAGLQHDIEQAVRRQQERDSDPQH